MSVDLRLPKINGENNTVKLQQMQSYMYQLVEQLNWALNNIETASSGNESTTSVVRTGSASTMSAAEAINTFNSIKALIIKSSDIVEAYGEKINQKLQSIYVAQSDFGTYTEQALADLEFTPQSISQNYYNKETIDSTIQAVTSEQGDITRDLGTVTQTVNSIPDNYYGKNEIDSMFDTIRESEAWIRTGLLDDSEEIPVYGVEVGQKTTVSGEEVFNKYARFTAGGIYFYTPGTDDPVAWMTGQKLYITNAEINGSLKLGKYQIDITDGIAFRWVG